MKLCINSTSVPTSYHYGLYSDKEQVKTTWTHYPNHLPTDLWKVKRIRMAFQLNIKKLKIAEGFFCSELTV
jgi:hypothetical protein